MLFRHFWCCVTMLTWCATCSTPWRMQACLSWRVSRMWTTRGRHSSWATVPRRRRGSSSRRSTSPSRVPGLQMSTGHSTTTKTGGDITLFGPPNPHVSTLKCTLLSKKFKSRVLNEGLLVHAYIGSVRSFDHWNETSMNTLKLRIFYPHVLWLYRAVFENYILPKKLLKCPNLVSVS